MRTLSGNKGFIRNLIWLFVLAALVYVGISFGKPYYRYMTLQSHSKDLLLMEIGDAAKIKAQVIADAEGLSIPLAEKDVEVTSKEHKVWIKAHWSEIVDFWGYYQKQLDFDMQVEN